MPGQDFGVYTGEAEAGTEVSSTYEGRHITVLETELIHPTHAADGLVDAGDPVIICNAGLVASRGIGVGVALTSATANTDYIAIDTEGIWNLIYFSYDDTGAGSDIIAGDALYIHDGSTAGVGALGTGDATISKRRNNVTQIPFGYALGTAAGGGTGQIPMKVHFDPICHWVGDDELMQFGDGAGGGPGVGGGDVTFGYDEALALLQMLPEVDDTPTLSIGNGVLSMDVEIFGMNAATSLLYDSSAGTLDLVNTVLAPTDRALTVNATMALAEGEGISGFFETTLTGQQAGLTYGLYSWLTLGGTFIATGTVTTPLDTGIYTGGANLAGARLIFGAQHMAILDSIPLSYYPWRINVSAGAGSITALIQAGNIQSVGYIAAVTQTQPCIGYIPIAFIAGIAAAQPGYVRVYTDTT